jgi:hypothetical protein
MSEPQLIARQRKLLEDLYRITAERSRDEPQVESDFRKRNETAEKDFQEGTHRVISRFETDKEASQNEFQETEQRVGKRFATERAAQDKHLADAQNKITLQYDTEAHAAEVEFQEVKRTALLKRKANKNKADALLDEARKKIDEAIEKREGLQKDAKSLLRRWRQNRDYGPLPEKEGPDRKYKDSFKLLEDYVGRAEANYSDLKSLRVPRWFEGATLWVYFLIVVLAAGGIGAAISKQSATPQQWYFGAGVGAGGMLVIGIMLIALMARMARNQVADAYLPLMRTLTDLDDICQEARAQARSQRQKSMLAAQKVYDQQLKIATDKHRKAKEAAKAKRDTALLQAGEKHDREATESAQRRDADLRQAHEKYQKLRVTIFEAYETGSHQLHERHFKQLSEAKHLHEQEWAAMANAWRQGFAEVHSAVDAVNRETQALFPDWNAPVWQNWAPPQSVPAVLPAGSYHVDLSKMPSGLPTDERLMPPVKEFDLPALVSFPAGSSIVLNAEGDGRTQAVRTLQALMIRYLTSLPPGKIRFTIIDPVGLGENFAAFMHLADYDEALVNSRIWTETAHIEQRMADLTAHMENVIQKYLRNQFQTIEEYNVHAGEVAEPYRIPVVANFPNNFSAEAARRLVSMVSSGARCGVYPLISVDRSQELPVGFSLANLEEHAVCFDWKEERFIWRNPDFGKFPLDLAPPPADEFSMRILHVVGERAKAAKRVEVPFEFIAVPHDQWWSSDSRAGIDVALGRVGATKRQHLRFGVGTAQHALVAGKTGSGKSTLMHALITNLSLCYSPEELELYLIDFKKGVEFKTYATHELPHARVVAIEGDREFGLSVLQRLDAELKRRGELFREVGAQDVKAYRAARPDDRCPRILLIVDEFQEFFSEDDKVSQECAGLLDRLVRQGRAFGLHLLMGSQTLGGAFSLARSTIDQMAVRIALQCSEADAHLILSDDNSAARLLSRPGEAIYNDANGLVEGNNPFQVVWLSETRREQLLDRVHDLDRQRNNGIVRSQVVFEGNAPAEITKNPFLHDLLAATSWPTDQVAFQAWLGEAMAIKDPTAAVFRRQTGCNVLILGQDDVLALGVIGSAILSLAAQHSPARDDVHPSAARFYVLDGTPAGTPHSGVLARLAESLHHDIRIVGWRDLEGMLTELTQEVQQRQKSNDVQGATLYLFINGLQRFRDLRRDENDYGFSGGEEKASPAKLLASLLREGPGLGVHVIVWCDTLNNVNRAFDRQAMREFEMRILFQMSANDSSNIIDSPLAGKLGPNRAYLHSEEQGKLEKFRPYGLPTDRLLAQLNEEFQRKTHASE